MVSGVGARVVGCGNVWTFVSDTRSDPVFITTHVCL
jgi:hypothetical protein